MKNIKWLFLILVLSTIFSACSIKGGLADRQNDFTLATWNIGHYSNGAKLYSTIDITSDEQILNKYRSFVYNIIAPDIIAINEYSKEYYKDKKGRGHLSSEELFDAFRWQTEGPQEWAICNALFSHIKLVNNGRNDGIYYSKNQKTITTDRIVSNRDNYFLESEIVWKGKTIKIVSVHLVFSTKAPGVYQQAQIREIIDRYGKYDRVIICGDWNIGNYKLLKEAGFTLAHNGTIITFPSKNYPLDNIAVKGLKISDVRAIQTDLSDHYPLVCKISLE